MDDCRQIENLMYTYAQRIDNGDFEGVAELFRHAEIVAPAHNASQRGYDEILQMYQQSTRLYEASGTPLTKHLITNVIIELEDGGNDAQARAYYTVLQATDEMPLQPIITGRYRDRFKKVDGQWQFARREMIVDQLGNLSAHLLFNSGDLA